MIRSVQVDGPQFVTRHGEIRQRVDRLARRDPAQAEAWGRLDLPDPVIRGVAGATPDFVTS